MRYISTRGGTPPMPFTDAVLTGLAPDGGLLLPEHIPDVRDRLRRWLDLSYVDLASELMGLFIDDIPAADVHQLAHDSYATFDAAEVAPLVNLRGETVLELFHGPTLAFKDVALQFLGRMFEYVLSRRGGEMNILGATSGDTGSAAIAGVRGRAAIRIFVMYPLGRTSRLQELQMTTVTDANVFNLALAGSFDDCQAVMKDIFSDLAFKQRFHLGAVNSVNWARVLAQIVYYFYAGLRCGALTSPVTFSVPTGNFGDIFAGYLAAKMGLPVRKLLLATNENDILSVFFNTGVYRRGSVYHTISPSMDIQVASNFERYLFYRLGGDSKKLLQFMRDFAEHGSAEVEGGARADSLFAATSVNREEVLAIIAEVYKNERYLLDPHTAVGVAAGRRLGGGEQVICLATAHPAKFPEAISLVLDPAVARHPRLDALADMPTRRYELPATVEVVKEFIRAQVEEHVVPHNTG